MQKAAEKQLLAAERLASVGTLAAGVAHEINNPLSVVILNVELVEHALQDAQRPSPGLCRAERAAEPCTGGGRARGGS